MKKISLAFDTSNYTTSCAFFDGAGGQNSSRLLDVRPGELGLRQSDALFLHTKRLPEVTAKLDLGAEIIAVGASSKPRETEDSYMPCFLAGVSHGRVLAHALGVPFFAFSHQQGHIAAAAWSAGSPGLLDAPMLAWHLSGGTTELLYAEPSCSSVTCRIIGGSRDVSAGQLIDRTGQMLGLHFPAGRELDRLSLESASDQYYRPKLDGLFFSLSGVEHKVKERAGLEKRDVAYFAMMSVVMTVASVTERATERYGPLPVLYSGGVASSRLMRNTMGGGFFSEPQYSADNAMGVAILTHRAVNNNNG